MSMSLDLYYYHADAGRSGALMGLFIAPIGLPERMVAEQRSVHWGEVLGKHSDVVDDFDEYSFGRHHVSGSLIEQMVYELKLTELHGWAGVYGINGYNPFEQLTQE